MLDFPFSFLKQAGGSSGGLTHTYNSGSGTETVPSGYTALTVKIWGKGGDGFFKTPGTGNAYGGGGAGYAIKTFVVAAGDVGKSITWNLSTSTVTVVGDATATNLTNTLLNFAVTPAGNGSGGSGGAGGVGSGGSTNLTGAVGANFQGGAAAGPGGGAGGAEGQNGFAPGGGGGGENVAGGPFAGTGANPRLIFEWS